MNLIQTSHKSQAVYSGWDSGDTIAKAERLKSWSRCLTSIIQDNQSAVFTPNWRFSGKITRKDFTGTLEKLRRCGSVLELRAPLDRETGELGNPRIHAANYCGAHVICPHCANRVQGRRLARFVPHVTKAAEAYKFAYMLTFTLPPSKTWGEGLIALKEAQRAFTLMGQRRRWKRKDGSYGCREGYGEWAKVKGALVKVELKRGAGSGLPHVHAHGLIFTDEAFDLRVYADGKKHSENPRDFLHPVEFVGGKYQAWDGLENDLDKGSIKAVSKVRIEWLAATDGRALNLDVRPIEMRDKDISAGLSWPESVAAQSIEVLKYSTKFDSSPDKDQEALYTQDFFEIREATYSRRLFSTYGIFRGLPEVEYIDHAEETHLSKAPMIYMAGYDNAKEKYGDLIEVPKPIFPNYGTAEETKEKYRVLNSYLGKMRRIRGAILRARDKFFQKGIIGPAEYIDRVFNGVDMVERPAFLGAPQWVLDNPGDAETWEQWADEFRTIARNGYGNLLDELRQKDNGPGADELHLEEMKKRPAWERSAAYWDHVAESFRRALNSRPEPNHPGGLHPWEVADHRATSGASP